MISLRGYRFDGKTSARQPVELSFFESGRIEVRADGIHEVYDIGKVVMSPRVGKIHAQFTFPDESICEIENDPRLEQVIAMLPKKSGQNFIHRIENRLRYILVTVVVSIATLYFMIQYGVPALAREVAFRIPIEMEKSMGEQAFGFFDGQVCAPSKLKKARQKQLEKYFRSNLKDELAYPVAIHFRNCKYLGANAFALPSGIIVFTDDMVKLAKRDVELLGVFAHEVGHVKYRHTMRHILQDSATALFLVLLTGDVGSASSLAATIPTVLVQAKFSRDFESESDDFAAQFLTERHLKPVHLGNILKRLEKNSGGEDGVPGFLSTHPLTKERYKKFKTWERAGGQDQKS